MNKNIRFPLKAKQESAGVWIEDASGQTLLTCNPLLVVENMDYLLTFAQLVVTATNSYVNEKIDPESFRMQYRKFDED